MKRQVVAVVAAVVAWTPVATGRGVEADVLGAGCGAQCDVCWIVTFYENDCDPSWEGDGDCDCGCQFSDAADCGSVPATSEWGVFVMLLISVCIGTVLFAKRKRQSA